MHKVTMKKEPETFGFLDLLLKDIRKYRFRLYLFLGAVSVLMIGVLLFLPNEYTAITRVMPKESSSTNQLASLASSIIPSELISSKLNAGTATEFDRLKELSTTNRVLDAVLSHSYKISDSQKKLNLYQYFSIEHKQFARDKLQSITSVNENIKSGVISVKATTTSPQLSSQIANQYINEIDLCNRRMKRDEAKRNQLLYQKELSRAEETLQSILDSQVQFLSHNRNYASSSDPALRQQVALYETKVLSSTKIVEGYKQLLASTRMDIDQGNPTIQVVEAATPPLLKSGPPRTRYLILSFFGALFFSIGLILMKNAYLWYFPKATQNELLSSIEMVRGDITHMFSRVRHSNRISQTKKETTVG